MHPQIVKDGPGTCPICKMDLVSISNQGVTNEIMLSESQIQLANITTMSVASGDFNTSKVLNGRLISNPEFSDVISSRYPGRIEKLFVKETGMRVAAGQLVFTIYSEELQTLQQDYILQQKQAAAFPNEQIYKSLRESAKSKLKLFGYSNAQIAALGRGGRAVPTVTVYAKAAGTVQEINVAEGQYVTEGSPVLRLENFNQLWLEADVYPAEIKQINVGMELKYSVNGVQNSGETAKVNFISPQIDPQTQLLKIRASIKNPGNFQPGMQATVILPVAEIKKAVSLPLAAVIRDEDGAHVFVKTGKNTFAPKMVKTGEEDAGQIIVTSGLGDVKEVVVSGAYLLWSEFILKKGADPMAGMSM